MGENSYTFNLHFSDLDRAKSIHRAFDRIDQDFDLEHAADANCFDQVFPDVVDDTYALDSAARTGHVVDIIVHGGKSSEDPEPYVIPLTEAGAEIIVLTSV